ncbi:MAG: hypothetical protein F4X54_09170 [Chloroflexi bacterium]|nr:hypothetical protein [Chloroflexota bacterium]MYA50020.1 hypothetical protein [Chloroflexota bacterium]MYB84887.1 hypothetical protein [Chloroflexota bacterium]
MGAETLKAGDKVELANGATAQVAGPLAGGTVPVTIIDSPFGPESPGDSVQADPDDIYGVFLDEAMTEVRAL